MWRTTKSVCPRRRLSECPDSPRGRIPRRYPATKLGRAAELPPSDARPWGYSSGFDFRDLPAGGPRPDRAAAREDGSSARRQRERMHRATPYRKPFQATIARPEAQFVRRYTNREAERTRRER